MVFEALSLGAVPVVADFGGPGDVVNADVGYKIPMSNEDDMILKLESILKHLAEDRTHLETFASRAWHMHASNLHGIVKLVYSPTFCSGPPDVARNLSLNRQSALALPLCD